MYAFLTDVFLFGNLFFMFRKNEAPITIYSDGCSFLRLQKKNSKPLLNTYERACSKAPPEYRLREINERWLKQLMDIFTEQGNNSVGGTVLLMCANTNKTKLEVENFLTATMPTLTTYEKVEQARAEGWFFFSLGGNHRAEAHRQFVSMGKLEWFRIKAICLSSIPQNCKNTIRGVSFFN